MTYKVIQWARGYVGEYSLKYILGNPNLELMGLKCFGEDKEGVDVGTIVGKEPVGVLATQSTEELLGLDADCVVYMLGDSALVDPFLEGSISQQIFKDVLSILERGKNVITCLTVFMGLEFKGDEGKVCLEQLECACQKGGSTFFATGIEPGFVGDDPVVAIEHISRMRSDFSPEWPNILPAGGYRIELAGSNPVNADFQQGLPEGNGNSFADAMVSTAARAVNSIDFVCEVSAGVKIFFDLSMITGCHSFHHKKNA